MGKYPRFVPGDEMWRPKPVDAEATYPLRQQVLRPHQALDEVGFPGDHDADTGHFALCAGDRIVGVVTVLHQPPPAAIAAPAPAPDEWWRLRGMAVSEECRHRGAGAALVSAVRDHVAAHQGRALWCHARLPAVAFYRALGFAPAGEPWEEPVIGPHVTMWRPLDRAP